MSVPDEGYYASDEGYHVPDEGYYVPDEGYYASDEGYYVPDEGYYVPDEGYYVPDEGYYTSASSGLSWISKFLLPTTTVTAIAHFIEGGFVTHIWKTSAWQHYYTKRRGVGS